MKIELVKKTELDPADGTRIWYVVKYDLYQKHFFTEDEAQKHVGKVKEHYEKFGTVQPIEELLFSDEINTAS